MSLNYLVSKYHMFTFVLFFTIFTQKPDYCAHIFYALLTTHLYTFM